MVRAAMRAAATNNKQPETKRPSAQETKVADATRQPTSVTGSAADEVIRKFINEGPTEEELQRAKAGLELDFLRGLESNLGKAEQLLSGFVFQKDAGYFSTEYQKTLAVTVDDVKRVAKQYLGGNRIVLSVVPKGKRDQASKAAESEKVSMVRSADQGGVR